MTTGRERFEGYVEALHQNKIPVEKELICQGLPKVDTGYLAAQKLLELSKPPTAIFAGNNLLTLGCLRAINEVGLKIPQEVSLVAFDDFEWSSLLKPALTVAAQPTYEIGRCACSLILERIANPNRPVQEIIFDTEIRIRQSCALHPNNSKVC
jgi:DNA-binding LacI/PurR family transcriptional regulator